MNVDEVMARTRFNAKLAMLVKAAQDLSAQWEVDAVQLLGSVEIGYPPGFADFDEIVQHLERLKAEVARLKAQLNTPEILDFIKGIQLEALHQRQRWGAAHDAGKTDADWFWLVGYLVGKALHKDEKRLHHLITAAAALFNWHLATLGKTDMRPGIPEAARGEG